MLGGGCLSEMWEGASFSGNLSDLDMGLSAEGF